MSIYSGEPVISVGLVEGTASIDFSLHGDCRHANGVLPGGTYSAVPGGGQVRVHDRQGALVCTGPEIVLQPEDPAASSFTIVGISIGRSFHWQRERDQRFRGELCLRFGDQGLMVINRIRLESYLQSVICSEMSPESPIEFLKAHCVISRSWLLAQLQDKATRVQSGTSAAEWTDVTGHRDFDVCADDHCQRYHGIAAVNPMAEAALQATRGLVLMHAGRVCDARFSKCCGGISECFATAWQDREVAYLQPVADTCLPAPEFFPPLAGEAAVGQFVGARPRVFCNVTDPALLARVLPDFDRETRDFFRWEVVLRQSELQELLFQKTGIDFGAVRAIVPQQRGPSGRLRAVTICGTRLSRTFGKELVIRGLFSPSHLYSSCFVVVPAAVRGGIPQQFTLRGAGWGHGVGLCQIGAAAMAAAGYVCSDILAHYFRVAGLQQLY